MKKITAIIIGAGSRGKIYARYSESHPDEFSVVSVADPNDVRRNFVREKYSLNDEYCFTDWRQVFNRPKFADTVFICTQDSMHFAPAMAAIENGYDIMLEKPISPDPAECLRLAEYAHEKNVKVLVCHVLRYTPFFSNIKSIIDSGKIGDIVSVMHNENVGYYHQAHSFVRGNWHNSRESSPMILAKCCHDMDILQWLIGKKCTRLSSFGSLTYFTRKNAPVGSPEFCIEGCSHADTCAYDAVKFYLTNEKNVSKREAATGKIKPTNAEVEDALRHGNYGKCVFKCDNDVVDHQVVNMEFEGGVTVGFSMCAFTPQINRTLKIMGTKGIINGKLGNKTSIETIDFLTGASNIIDDEEIKGPAGHGGGDVGIMEAFCGYVRGDYTGNSICDISVSAENHMLSFAAEEARISGKIINLSEFCVRTVAGGGKPAGK